MLEFLRILQIFYRHCGSSFIIVVGGQELHILAWVQNYWDEFIVGVV